MVNYQWLMNVKMPVLLLFLFLSLVLLLYFGRGGRLPFWHQLRGKASIESIQKKYSKRVWKDISPALKNAGFDTFPQEVRLLAFKEEKRLEIYGWKDNSWKFLLEYPFTASSGVLGPKLKNGDRQTPEGIYQVEYLNPNSAYHLSVKINYPNAFDLEHAALDGREDLGGDIFIHGKAVTIGCIPIGDKAIEEVFLICSHALKNNLQVIVSPRDFRVNPELPVLENILWEEELYTQIKTEIQQISRGQ